MKALKFLFLFLYINITYASDFQSFKEIFEKKSGHELLQLGSAFTIYDCHSYRADRTGVILEQYIFRYVIYQGLVRDEYLEFLAMRDLRGVYPNGAYTDVNVVDGQKTFTFDEWAFRALDENSKYILMEHKDKNGDPDFYSMCFPAMAFPEP